MRIPGEGVHFRLGEIEHLPVGDASTDMIISNCVINLSPVKSAVFKEAYRTLKPGGRLAVSDIVATADIPEDLKDKPDLYCWCATGAALVRDFKNLFPDWVFATSPSY